MNPYKTTHTVVTPQGTYTTTLEFAPADESAPGVSPIMDDLIDAAIANTFITPQLSPTEEIGVRYRSQRIYNDFIGTPALKASKAVSQAMMELLSERKRLGY